MLKEDSVQSEYDSEMEEYDSDSEDLVVIMGGDDGQESGTNTTAKVNAGEDGLITIRNEDNVSAYNIDINKLKTQKWKMEGDESDYFNYGFNESMWKVLFWFFSDLQDYVMYVKSRRDHVDVRKLEEYSYSLVAQVPSV